MLLTAWAATNLQSEPEVRTVLFASGTVLSYLQNAFLPIAAFPASEAPHWRIGAWVYLALAIVALSMFIAIHFLFKYYPRNKRERERRAANSGVREVTEAQ